MPDSALPSLTFLDWTIEIETDSGVEEDALSDLDEAVPAGTDFTLTGTVNPPGHLYAVQLTDDSLVVLYPAEGKTDQEPAGTTLRLPSDETEFVAPVDGVVQVFVASSPVQPADWSKLFPGHDPDPKGSGGKDMVVVRIIPVRFRRRRR